MKAPLNRLWLSTIATLSIALPVFLTSCSNATDTAVTPASSTDEVAQALLSSNHPIDQCQAEDDEMLPLSPRDRENGSKLDPTKLQRRHRQLPLPCLGLTPEQMAQIRQFQAALDSANRSVYASIQTDLDALRQQEQAAWEAFRQATASQREQLAALYRQFRAQVDSIRQLVRSGALSRDEARIALRQLTQDFFAARKAILDSTADARATLKAELEQIAQERQALMASIQAQLETNYQQFLSNVASILTPEQLEIWQRWLNGEDPCKGRGPRG